MNEENECVLEFVGQDVDDLIKLFFKTCQTENRYVLRIVVDKRKQVFTMRIGDKAVEFNKFEFRDFISMLSGWFESVRSQFFKLEEEAIGKLKKY